MSDQTNSLHSQVVILRMQGKTTEELQEIWQENDKSKWSKEDFDAVQKVLLERSEKLPEQKNPAIDNEHVKSSSQNVSGQNASSNNINAKYPYLTAYVGFVALSTLIGLVLGFISFPPEFGLIIQIFVGFFIFRFVVEKNILPHLQEK